MLGNRESKSSRAMDTSKKYALVSFPVHPSKNRLDTQFTDSQALPKTTFHNVNRVIEKNDYEVVAYYLKENPPDSIASELEAVCAAYYKLFAPDYVPATYAVYDKANRYIGVASEEILNFKSLAVDPLKDEDLKVDFLEERQISFETVEKLEKEIHTLEEQANHLEKRSKKLDQIELRIQNGLKDNNDAKKLIDLANEFEANAYDKIQLFKVRAEVENKKIEFYKSLEEKHNIRKKELDNFRIVKGLAHSLTTSYIFMEDDLHQNNLSKSGKRIDFDMSLWPILYRYKDSKLTYFRQPTQDTFKVTSRDIINFPNLKDAKPFYWPTHSVQAYSSSFLTTVSSMLPFLLSNAYPKEANALYQKLEKNSVFEYYKFNILSKYILTYADIYKSIAYLHMRKECMIESDYMINYLARQQADRIMEFENALVNIPDFGNFFKKHHERIVAELIEELSSQQINVDSSLINETRIQLLAIIEVNLKKINALPSRPSTEFKEQAGVKFVTLSSFEEAKSDVISAMATYLNPSFSFLRTRTHNQIAIEIKKFCEKLKPNLDDKNAPLENMKMMYIEIISKMQNLPNTGMRTQLTDLVAKIKAKLPVAEIPEFKLSEPQVGHLSIS